MLASSCCEIIVINLCCRTTLQHRTPHCATGSSPRHATGASSASPHAHLDSRLGMLLLRGHRSKGPKVTRAPGDRKPVRRRSICSHYCIVCLCLLKFLAFRFSFRPPAPRPGARGPSVLAHRSCLRERSDLFAVLPVSLSASSFFLAEIATVGRNETLPYDNEFVVLKCIEFVYWY